MSNNREISLIVNGGVIPESSQVNGEIGLLNNGEKNEPLFKKVKAENLAICEVYELYINPNYDVNELLHINIKLSVFCDKDEIPFIILKEYWDNIEEGIEEQDEEIVEKLLTNNHAIPCILPKFEEKHKNDAGAELFSFKSIDFRNIFRTLKNGINKSFYLFITKVKPVEQRYPLGISFLEYKEETLIPAECNIHEMIESSDKKIAIFVHGIASRVGANFAGLYRCLENEFNIFAFNYDSISKEITENGESLSSGLSIFDGKPVHIFAHSMGGLVSRSAIIEHNANVQALLMAGTPNNGAKIAKKVHRAVGIKGAFRKIFIGALLGLMDLTYNDIMAVRRGNMPGLEDLYPKSLITNILNNNESFKTPYLVLAGKKFNKQKDGVVEVSSMCNVRGILLPNIPIDNCFHTKYFIANPSFNLPDIVSEARLYLKI